MTGWYYRNRKPECTVKGCACEHHDTKPRYDTELTARDLAVVAKALGLDAPHTEPLFGNLGVSSSSTGTYRFTRIRSDRTEHGVVVDGVETIETTEYHEEWRNDEVPDGLHMRKA